MNTRKLICKTVDFKYFLNGLIWFGSACLFFGILSLIISIYNDKQSALSIASSFLLLFLIPVTIYYIVRIIFLFRHAQDYVVYSAKTIKADSCVLSLWRSHSFQLEITKEDNETFTAETNGVFHSSVLSSCYFGNYFNQPLQVLYNPNTQTPLVVAI